MLGGSWQTSFLGSSVTGSWQTSFLNRTTTDGILYWSPSSPVTPMAIRDAVAGQAFALLIGHDQASAITKVKASGRDQIILQGQGDAVSVPVVVVVTGYGVATIVLFGQGSVLNTIPVGGKAALCGHEVGSAFASTFAEGTSQITLQAEEASAQVQHTGAAFGGLVLQPLGNAFVNVQGSGGASQIIMLSAAGGSNSVLGYGSALLVQQEEGSAVVKVIGSGGLDAIIADLSADTITDILAQGRMMWVLNGQGSSQNLLLGFGFMSGVLCGRSRARMDHYASGDVTVDLHTQGNTLVNVSGSAGRLLATLQSQGSGVTKVIGLGHMTSAFEAVAQAAHTVIAQGHFTSIIHNQADVRLEKFAQGLAQIEIHTKGNAYVIHYIEGGVGTIIAEVKVGAIVDVQGAGGEELIALLTEIGALPVTRNRPLIIRHLRIDESIDEIL